MSISVTFDSNVWEIIVDEEKRKKSDPIYGKLFDFIISGKIKPFFFEGLATIETVKKKDRKSYIANYKANFSTSVDGEKDSSYEGSGGPEVSKYLNKFVPLALSLGFRFTHFPRKGAPLLNIPKQYWAPDEIYSTNERQKRTFECARFIESLGVRKGLLMNMLDATNGGLVQKTKADNSITEKNYSSAMGEWADGDALAANFGYGIDYFCTKDRASSAGISSIFHSINLKKLEKKYPINVVSPEELIQKMSAIDTY